MKLSIITINYNNLAGLQRTIDSVVCQTWHDYEWIIIDGGSSDGSKELIEQYQEYITYWCSEPDKGIYNAMNKGIDHAHGDYLIFMNSGDAFASKDVLERVFDNPITVDILFGQVVSMESGKIISSNHTDEVSPLLFLMNTCYAHQGAIIKRFLFNHFKYDEQYKIASDWKFWMEAIVFGESSFAFTDIVIARQDEGGISNTNDELLRKERHQIFLSLFPPIVQQDLTTYTKLHADTVVNNSQYLLEHCYPCYYMLRKLSTLMVKTLRVLNNEK